jgi:hypothetical protein
MTIPFTQDQLSDSLVTAYLFTAYLPTFHRNSDVQIRSFDRSKRGNTCKRQNFGVSIFTRFLVRMFLFQQP